MTLEERIEQMLKEAVEKEQSEATSKTVEENKELTEDFHRVKCSLSDPEETEETGEESKSTRTAKIAGAKSKEDAIDRAKKYYKKLGFKVHSAEHVGTVNESKVEGQEEIVEEAIEVAPVEKIEEKAKPDISKQVAALLEAEGLSEEFKLQAVTIFEAAVTDRVIQIEESLNEKFEERVAEAEAKFEQDKAELSTKIDGFLNESAQKWATDNEVAIKTGFRVKLAESFMDGLAALMKEHNVVLAEEAEDALTVALDRVSVLESDVSKEVAKTAAVVEELNAMKANLVRESYREKMTATAFDRFVQLTESVKFAEQDQYETQLRIVFENFGSDQAPIVESFKEETVKVIVEDFKEESNVDASVAAYAAYMAGNAR